MEFSMNQKKCIFLLLILLPGFVFAQTAARLEALLAAPQLTWLEVVDFVLDAAELGDPDQISEESAFRFAVNKNWLPKNVSSGDVVRLNGVSLLIMQSFGLKGGIFYNITKSPHHAYRELTYKNVITGNTDPGMSVSGQQLLLMISRILAIKEQS